MQVIEMSVNRTACTVIAYSQSKNVMIEYPNIIYAVNNDIRD